MGTSISHPSPNNQNWKPAKIGYEKPQIPVKTMISQIWRASENQETPLSVHMGSNIVFQCHEIVRNSTSIPQAMKDFSQAQFRSKQNSIVAEFAKRAIPMAIGSDNPTQTWRSAFFSELTNYIVSRDASGYVGPSYRNKSIADLSSFKATVRGEVSKIIGGIKQDPTNQTQWINFISDAISKVRGGAK
ncbi:MAG: hypothetical protein AAF388_07050 [Bacteroidota bacterium]